MDSEQRLKKIEDAIARASNISIKELFDKGNDAGSNFFRTIATQNQWKEVTMATIEERANIFACVGCDKKDCKKHICGCTRASYRKIDYMAIATEQGAIARQEERERCIRKAEQFIWNLYEADDCDRVSVSMLINQLRKAMEGGEG